MLIPDKSNQDEKAYGCPIFKGNIWLWPQRPGSPGIEAEPSVSSLSLRSSGSESEDRGVSH